jgi:dUTP diphosphatase
MKELTVVRFAKLRTDAVMPTYAKPGDSGLDLHALDDVVLPAGGRAKLCTGVALDLPSGYEAQIRPRSSLSAKGVICAWGTCDCGYKGELGVVLYNVCQEDYTVSAGDKIAQLVVSPVPLVVLVEIDRAEMSASARGEAGWGSSGR